jgi:hypothetical protein
MARHFDTMATELDDLLPIWERVLPDWEPELLTADEEQRAWEWYLEEEATARLMEKRQEETRE